MKKVLLGLLLLAVLVFALIFILELSSSYTASKTIHANAPVKTRKTIIIQAPVEKVWHVMSDINNWKSWQRDISSSQINGAFQPGTTFDWKSGGLSIHSTLHTVFPFKTIGWSGKAFGSFAIHVWSFDAKDGYTIVTTEESMEGWLVTLMKKYFQPKLDEATQNWLVYLKNRSENIK